MKKNAMTGRKMPQHEEKCHSMKKMLWHKEKCPSTKKKVTF